jgi:uncharacterized membrane protein
VLWTFTGDRGNQLVLGVFIATFTYALLVLRTVREAPDDTAEAFVPSASVTLAILLALASIGFLIYYINHAANSIRAVVVIDRAARDTLGLIDGQFPAGVSRQAEPLPREPDGDPVAVHADSGGYLQAINTDALFALDEDLALAVRIDVPIGAHVLPGEAVAGVWATRAVDDDLKRRVIAALVLGSERTLQTDLELGIRQVADIAVRALSPGINDPTTAMNCIDRLAEVLTNVACRDAPPSVWTRDGSRTRVILEPVPYGRLVSVAFAQIRHFGCGDAIVARHLVTTLGKIAEIVPPQRWPPLVEQAQRTVQGARTRIEVAADLAEVEWAAHWTRVALPDSSEVT